MLIIFNFMDQLLDLFAADKNFADQELEELVLRSIKIKADIVMQDETEQGGIRQLLNFGHTVAHAIERELNFNISHGQAVLIGIWVASQISKNLEYLSDTDLNKIQTTLQKITYENKAYLDPVQIGNLPQHMMLDKKSIAKEARFVLINEVGSAVVQKNHFSFPVAKEVLIDALKSWSENQE